MSALERFIYAVIFTAGGLVLAFYGNNEVTRGCGVIIVAAGLYMLVRSFAANKI